MKSKLSIVLEGLHHLHVNEGLKSRVPKDLREAFDEFWEEYGANDYREFMWKMDKFIDWYPRLVTKYPNYIEYAEQYLREK